MKNRTFTRWQLTQAQCRVLASFIAEEQSGKRYTHKHGVAAGALERKGLVTRFDDLPRPYPCCTITDEGRQAYAAARAEGW